MPLFVRIRPKFVRKRISSLSTKFRINLKKTTILPSRNFHIYWPLCLMQITTPSSPDTLRYKVWFPSFDLEQTGNWGTFGLGRRLQRNIFNLTHTHTYVMENIKESFYHTSLSFEIVKCFSMFKFGVMYGQIFHCFYSLLRNVWKRQIQGPRNIEHFLQVCVQIALYDKRFS
jgi:hypothetical protein